MTSPGLLFLARDNFVIFPQEPPNLASSLSVDLTPQERRGNSGDQDPLSPQKIAPGRQAGTPGSPGPRNSGHQKGPLQQPLLSSGNKLLIITAVDGYLGSSRTAIQGHSGFKILSIQAKS